MLARRSASEGSCELPGIRTAPANSGPNAMPLSDAISRPNSVAVRRAGRAPGISAIRAHRRRVRQGPFAVPTLRPSGRSRGAISPHQGASVHRCVRPAQSEGSDGPVAASLVLIGVRARRTRNTGRAGRPEARLTQPPQAPASGSRCLRGDSPAPATEPQPPKRAHPRQLIQVGASSRPGCSCRRPSPRESPSRSPAGRRRARVPPRPQ